MAVVHFKSGGRNDKQTGTGGSRFYGKMSPVEGRGERGCLGRKGRGATSLCGGRWYPRASAPRSDEGLQQAIHCERKRLALAYDEVIQQPYIHAVQRTFQALGQ